MPLLNGNKKGAVTTDKDLLSRQQGKKFWWLMEKPVMEWLPDSKVLPLEGKKRWLDRGNKVDKGNRCYSKDRLRL